MAKVNGRKWLVYEIITATATAIPLGTTASLNINNNVIDASDKDSGGWRQLIDGQRDWDVSMTANYDQEQAKQMGLIDAILNVTTSTERTIGIGLDDAVGDILFQGQALVASTPISGDNEALVTIDYDFQGTGELTKTTKQ